MGINNIMQSYEAAIDLIPVMSQNYKNTFKDSSNKSDYYLNQTNNFISKLDLVFREYNNKKFDNINPRKSEVKGDNSLRPSFVTVKYFFYKKNFFLVLKIKNLYLKQNLGNYTDPKTNFGQIVTSIGDTYLKAIDSFETVQDYANKFIQNSDSIKEIMLEILRRLQKFQDISDKIQKNFTNIWFETVK